MWNNIMYREYQKEALDFKKHIIKSPFKSISRQYHRCRSDADETISEIYPTFGHGGQGSFTLVNCKEHNHVEMVPSGNFHDLDKWYEIGVHPRFSIHGALRKAGYRYAERHRARSQQYLADALRQCKSEKHFLKLIDKNRPVWLYRNRLKFRVPKSFRDKYQNGGFTNKEYLDERNHELRRLMLRKGCTIEGKNGILSHLGEPYATDNEGELYHDPHNNRRSLLHVICPSTTEHYLLRVPRYENDGRAVYSYNAGRDIYPPEMTPAEAKRWTMQVPKDAVFMSEA